MVKQQTVMIVADNSGFAREVVSRWQGQPGAPGFTMVTSELWRGNGFASCDLAIVGALNRQKFETVLRLLGASGTGVICVAPDAETLQALRAEFPRMLLLEQSGAWLETLLLVAGETLKRIEASSKAKRSAQELLVNSREAALGKFMLESRHSFNNALTSILGNAELMLLENGTLPDHVREQVDTIHTMALRLHEMMQRFTSLEQELSFNERQNGEGDLRQGRAYVSGS